MFGRNAGVWAGRLCGVSAALTVALAAPAEALGSPQFEQTARVYFTSHKPNTLTSATLNLTVHDRGAPLDKPKEIADLVWRLPRGTTYHPKRLLVCRTDAYIRGEDCPKLSQVGAGAVFYNWLPLLPSSGTWYTTPAGTITAYNAKGQYLPNGGWLLVVDMRNEVFQEGALLSWPARFSREGVLKTFWPAVTEREAPIVYPLLEVLLTVRGPRGGAVLRTPRRCNPKEGWMSSVRTEFVREAPNVFRDTTERNKVRIRCRTR